MDTNNQDARSDLLAYANAQFPNADGVRLLPDDFDREIVGVVQLKFHGARVSAGFSRELWERSQSFEDLRAFMERHLWRETVNTATNQKALLGQGGWLDWK